MPKGHRLQGTGGPQQKLLTRLAAQDVGSGDWRCRSNCGLGELTQCWRNTTNEVHKGHWPGSSSLLVLIPAQNSQQGGWKQACMNIEGRIHLAPHKLVMGAESSGRFRVQPAQLEVL